MADLSQNKTPIPSQAPSTPPSNQPPMGQTPADQPKRPKKFSFPPMQQGEKKPISPKQEEMKKELSVLGISPKGGSKKTKILMAILGILFFVATLPAAIYLVKQRQEIRKQAYDFTCADLGSEYYCSSPEACRGECTSAGEPSDCSLGEVCCDGLCMEEGGECPFDVSPYVNQVAGSVSGLYLCNAYSSEMGCLELQGVPEGCTYLAEAYTDSPQQCHNQQTNLKIRRTITNGGKVCFSDINWGSDCMAQLDIRYDDPSAPAGNLKAYKIDCGVVSSPTPPPTSPTPPPTSPTPPPGEESSCSNATITDKDDNVIDPETLSLGDEGFILVSGDPGTQGSFDEAKARIYIRRETDSDWVDPPSAGFFCPASVIDYFYCQSNSKNYDGSFPIPFAIPEIIPGVTAGEIDFKIEAFIHHTTDGWK